MVKDYFYFKTSGYFTVVQVVVDCNKRFYNVCQGLLGNVNDFRVLFKHVQYDNLFDVSKGCGDDIVPYLLGDECYSLINWSMTPFKEEEIHIILKFLYNRKDKCSRFVIENAFWILKNFCCCASLIWMLFLFLTSLFVFWFQNMLRNIDKISIECLFHIIELEESINQTKDILRIMDGAHN